MKLRALALASVFAAFAATPALAAWDRVGAIDIHPGVDADTASPDFGGPVERLRFTARNSALICPSIKATFGNGDKQQIFSGRIAQGDSKTVDLPGNQRTIKRLSTLCHADGSGGKLEIEADAGQYRAVWLKNPNWAHLWGSVASAIDANMNYWVLLGEKRFVGKNDTDQVFAGWQGRSISAIALKSRDDDARCTKVVARFANGQVVRLNAPGLMTADRNYRLDVPGGERNLTGLTLSCRAVHGKAVTVRIFAQK